MNKKALRVPDYLHHILDAIERIERYTAAKSLGDFKRDEQCQDAVIRNIEIIGEAARNVQQHSPDFVERHREIPWAALYAMRNRTPWGQVLNLLTAPASGQAFPAVSAARTSARDILFVPHRLQPRIHAPTRHQLRMRPALDDAPRLHHQDLIRLLDRR
ncbi:MAG: hypothetical protein PWP40_894 [Rhodocyclaceae bacterium]|nr:hypothetical protein [Rhodocyclaceae bacterium]